MVFARQRIFVPGVGVWEVSRYRSWVATPPDGYHYVHSESLVCPRCLKVWAVLHFQGDGDPKVQGAYCAEHGDGRLLSIYGPLDVYLLEALPEPLLRREFELTLKYLEREGEGK